MHYLCRVPGKPSRDPEELMRFFLLNSFDSEFVYIVSPWVSSFRFSKNFIYYPYVSTREVIEVLEALRDKGVDIHLLVRCFDDFLSPDFIFTLYHATHLTSSSGSSRVSMPPKISEYLKDQLNIILSRLEASEKFVNLGINIKFDLGINDRTFYRLHAKIYVNDRLALVGSANFTRGGVVRGGNWECLLLVGNDDRIYNEILDEAKRLIRCGKDFHVCEERVIGLVNEVLGQYGVRVRDLDDLKALLKEIYLMI